MTGNRGGKTEQSLSLLRALLANRQVPDANRISITVGELRALAAAEAAPLDVEPETLEAKAGKMLVEAARLRLQRGGPNDAHEVRHLYAAIQYGNSDDENDGCRLDTQLVAEYAALAATSRDE